MLSAPSRVSPGLPSLSGKEAALSALGKTAISLFIATLAVDAAQAQSVANNALPTQPAVVAGQATINSAGNRVDVVQTSNTAVINWQTYNVGKDARVNYVQPSASAIALNRVIGPMPTTIDGRLTANGQVFLINPAGIYIGSNARIDVGGLVASTLGLKDEDFLAGKYRFVQEGNSGNISNSGSITAADGGYIALLAPEIRNNGVLAARLGTVALGAGSAVTLDFSGDQLVGMQVDPTSFKSLIENKEAILAEDGLVILSALSSNDLAAGVINLSGLIKGSSIEIDAGKGNAVLTSATLDASNASPQGRGGKVEVLGNRVGLLGTTHIDASGETGGGTVLLGGDYQGKGPQANATFTYVGSQAEIKANALNQGDGGKVIVWSDRDTVFRGAIEARGGPNGGNGGLVETSGMHSLTVSGKVDAAAPMGKAGSWLLDPTDINVVASGADTANLSDVDQFADPDITAGSASIDVAAINGAVADVTLQATNNINFNTDINISNSLRFQAIAGNNINFNSPNIVLPGNNAHVFSANDNSGGTASGVGRIWLWTNVSIDTTSAAGGGVTFKGPIEGSGAGLTIRTDGGAVSFTDSIGAVSPLGHLRIGGLLPGSVSFAGNSITTLGEIDIAGVFTSTNPLTLDAATNPINIAQFNNVPGPVNLKGGDISVSSATPIIIGNADATGHLQIISQDSLTFQGAANATTLFGQSGGGKDITIAPGAQLTATGTGTALVLDANTGRFMNNAGPNALSAPNGHWLVYSFDWAADSHGGLSGSNLYNQTYAGSQLAVSVAGTGYLRFQKTDGSVVYTRSSRLIRAADGTLIDAATGYALFFNVVVPAGTLRVIISSDGTVTAIQPGNVVTVIGAVNVAVFADPSALQPDGGGFYYETLASGMPLIRTPGFGAGDLVVGIDVPNLAGPAGNYFVYGRQPILTVVADPSSSIYGDVPLGTFSISGLVNGDTASYAYGGAPQLAVAANAQSGVGNYAVSVSAGPSPGGLQSPVGYGFSFSGGTHTVTPRPLAVTGDSLTKLLGNADPALTYTIGALGLVNGDQLSGSLIRIPGESPGQYSIQQGTLAAGPNYSMSFVDGVLAIQAPPCLGPTCTPIPTPTPPPPAATAPSGTIAAIERVVDIPRGDRPVLSAPYCSGGSCTPQPIRYEGAIDILRLDPAVADLPECDDDDEGDEGECIVSRSTRSPARSVSIAKRHAFLIGINDYKATGVDPLETPIGDAESLGALLKQRFGYEVHLLRNPRKQDIVSFLNGAIDWVGPDDSVLIFYAGHGYQFEKQGLGYWLPLDAESNSPRNWLSNVDIQRYLSLLPAKQIALISDSCFSGSLTEKLEVADIGAAGKQRILSRRSVVVMTSGDEEPVSDEGREGHSIFAWALLKSLRETPGLSAISRIFPGVRADVTSAAEQTPQLGAVVKAGHDQGTDYLLEPVSPATQRSD